MADFEFDIYGTDPKNPETAVVSTPYDYLTPEQHEAINRGEEFQILRENFNSEERYKQAIRESEDGSGWDNTDYRLTSNDESGDDVPYGDH